MMSALKAFENSMAKTGASPVTTSLQCTTDRGKTDKLSKRFKAVQFEGLSNESQDIRDHLVLGDPLMKLTIVSLGEISGNKPMTGIQKLITFWNERCICKLIQEWKRKTKLKIAVVRRNETKHLVEADNKLVNQLAVDDKQRQNSRDQLKERSNSQGR